MVTAMFGLGPLNPRNKGGSQYSKDVTRTQQQRPESPMATLTWRASKYKVHQLTERYILEFCGVIPSCFVLSRPNIFPSSTRKPEDWANPSVRS